MSLKPTFLVLMLWSLPLSPLFGQILADFTFDDTSNGAASLKKNAAGADALSINPNARSDGEGVYTLPDQAHPNDEQNLDLAIPESLFSHTESIYMEWDFRSQENFAWLIFSGHSDGLDLFRFAHVNYPDDPSQQGFHIRYATKANPATVISSGYVGEALPEGERATIAFMYEKESGTAYLFKNGTEIWQTPEEQKTPGYAFHWQSANGNFLVGAAMNGGGSGTPFLYRFRAFEEACAEASPPLTQGDTICSPGPLTLTALGGEEGRYKWYKPDGEGFAPIPDEHGSTYVSETLYQTTTYYVSVATENCESSLVPVKAVVLQEPEKPEVRFTTPCGPGEVSLYISNKQKDFTYRWYAQEGASSFSEADSLLLQVKRDTTLYVSAYNGNCESRKLPVNISPKALPVIDAGPDRRIFKGESIDLSASGSFASCSWIPHKSLEFPDSPNPRVSPEATQSYIVTAVNAAGCELSDTVMVYVLDKFPVPNAFSPNNDGTNDTWEIPAIKNYPDCKIEVFNKWGNKVFSSNGYAEPWDGTARGNSLPSGSYYYTLKLSETKEAIQGVVLIFR